MSEQQLTEDGRSGLARARFLAFMFVMGSLIVPAMLWFKPSDGARPHLDPSWRLLWVNLAVASLLAVGLAARAWLRRCSLQAASLDSFRSLRLLAVVVPAAFAEMTAVFGAVVGARSGRDPFYVVTVVPALVALWILWPRTRDEAGAESTYLAARALPPGAR